MIYDYKVKEVQGNEVSLNDFLNEDSNEDDDLSLRVVTDTKEAKRAEVGTKLKIRLSRV